MVALGKQFEEELLTGDIAVPGDRIPFPEDREQFSDFMDYVSLSGRPTGKKKPLPAVRAAKPLAVCEEVYRALVLGTGDYMRKNGFKSAVIGLSGGIDSSLVAAVAVAAMGKENVTGVFMPSQYSSNESCEDAYDLAHNLGIKILEIPIKQTFESYLTTLRGVFAKTKIDVTEENLQARIRGNILMALSNKFGWLVLTTGNKSEMSVGYATLYGDMAGGFAVIKDVPKTLVYEVSRCVNRLAGKTRDPEAGHDQSPDRGTSAEPEGQ